jgi:hypothetical protein
MAVVAATAAAAAAAADALAEPPALAPAADAPAVHVPLYEIIDLDSETTNYESDEYEGAFEPPPPPSTPSDESDEQPPISRDERDDDARYDMGDDDAYFDYHLRRLLHCQSRANADMAKRPLTAEELHEAATWPCPLWKLDPVEIFCSKSIDQDGFDEDED